MRPTETVLNVLSERGKNHKPVERLHRQLYNIGLHEMAYGQIYANRGATTRGVNDNTLDGTSRKRFERTIERVKTGTYKWNPTRRTYIPKRGGKLRPLGIPTGDDKQLQTAMKILLESYYEPQFSERSHGFRQGRGCHTALIQVRQKFKGAAWFIEGDIKGCFDNIDHKTLIEILAENIKDSKFLRLVKSLLKAGYMEKEMKYDTFSGTPQGGVISPLLANIYLNELDKWVEQELMPCYNRSHKERGRRRSNLEYMRLHTATGRAKRKGDFETAKMLRKTMKTIPAQRVNDSKYRKLEYIRYADDFILGFAGPKKEAEEIKERISRFLKDKLNLEMSQEKTLISHAKTKKARFLGYDIGIQYSQSKRSVNGKVWFGIPREVVSEYVRKYTRKGKATHRAYMLHKSDYQIVRDYQAEYRGVVNYYCMAHNINKLSKVRWVCETSLLKTLANKHKTSVNKTAQKYANTRKVGKNTYKVFQAEQQRDGKKPLISYYGAVPLKRNPLPTRIIDNLEEVHGRGFETINRLRADKCEMCGTGGPVEMHHHERMKKVHKKGKKSLPAWKVKMIAMRRKTLATCWPCHYAIHNGVHRPEWDEYQKELTQRGKTEKAG